MVQLLNIAAAGLALAAPFAAAVGRARVFNNCDTTVYLWSVGASVSNAWGIDPKTEYSEEFVKDPVTGGKALKITRVPNGLYNGAPQTIFAYSLDNAQVWYDLSDTFGDAFAGSKLVEASANQNCPAIVWDNGVPPAGSQVKTCTADADVTLTLCAA
ncbi:uncharacterized protein E0L32_006086 [Thyridium curvatum]|uniref:Uncharacterized protein n=1 Tax=Thyridium curvatum TaxID=1093900 RepID=A0A507AS39_9PEZI|nr:uncharacterized protein E0L32_006086 [Thyridium curvatum]TPX13615.1 hypothetical protein E0L32_006086 [Thyridium curvatum]